MRKIRLDVDQLQVTSFTTQAAEKEKGTVHGHAETLGAGETCIGNTCWDSCDGVCGTYYCVPTDGNSCQQATCIIYSCQCTFTCRC
ncbi:MAG TPA: hypothetical protein VF092_23340 [Longimicrobium sp.]